MRLMVNFSMQDSELLQTLLNDERDPEKKWKWEV